MGIVTTIEGRCEMCFSCIRNCPVKAIKVEQGQAAVVSDLCIYCGHCVEVCTQKAKTVISNIQELEKILVSSSSKIACLAPSFVGEFFEVEPLQVVAGLKNLGFDHVYEVALGAEMVSQEYKKFLSENMNKGYISTACPSIVYLVEKYFPDLISKLVPIVSPMIALGRYLKEKYGANSKVVFIGPCTAKKAELNEPGIDDCVELGLTYPELRSLFQTKGINLSELKGEEFTNEPIGTAKIFPLTGGLLKSASIQSDLMDNNIMTVEGRENSLEFLKAVSEKNIKFDFADILFCNGCINGPMYSQKTDHFFKLQLVKEYTNKHLNKAGPKNNKVDFKVNLNREFINKAIQLPEPTEKEIQEVLAGLEKFTKEDELNCGACGYGTCREKASAVVRGLAESQMCLPYLIKKLEKSNLMLKRQLKQSYGEVGKFVGTSKAMQQVYSMIKKVAKTDSTVLLLGESGTGKELAAQALHQLSLRADKDFISVNCAALPETLLESELFGHVKGSFTGAISDKKGLFEEADKATIFLDEIGDVSLALQAKLLRVLQEGEFLRIGDTKTRKVDVRVIAATNKDLKKLIEQGKFRSDLYYRLNVLSIKLPPLREKKEDIPLLAVTFLQKFNKKFNKSIARIHPDVISILMGQEWKGNVRELENVIERAVILCEGDEIKVEDLPGEMIRNDNYRFTLGPDFSYKEYIDNCQRQIILEALEKNQGVQAKAAKMLGLNRSTLHEMIKRLNIEI